MSMLIFVEMFTGGTVTLDVEAADSIEAMKQKIQDIAGVPPDIEDLIYAGTMLEDDLTLADYSIQHEATLQLVPISGVVTYDFVDETAPPDGGTQLAHLRGGAAMGQRLDGISGGSTYALSFWAQGSLQWSVQFLDASDHPVDVASGVVTGDPPGLAPFSLPVTAPPTARAAQLTLRAADVGPGLAAAFTGPAAVLFDLVTFAEAPPSDEPGSAAEPSPAEPASAIEASPTFTG